MDIFLIVVVCVLAVLLLFAMCLLVVIYGHPDDKNQAKLPKLITVMGLWIAFASLLILPYDVANSKGGGGGVRVDLLWQIIYITLAVFITFLIPFAFFYYESDMDEEEAAEAGFCDSQCGNGLKYTFAFAVFFIVVMGNKQTAYAQLGCRILSNIGDRIALLTWLLCVAVRAAAACWCSDHVHAVGYRYRSCASSRSESRDGAFV